MSELEQKHLLIVYHSQSGRNERLAYAAYSAAIAAEPNVDVRLRRAAETGTRDVVWSDGLLLFFPENFGAIAGGMKDFLDRTFYPVLERNLIRPYAVFICAGNDGGNALSQFNRIAKGYLWRSVSEPIVVTGRPDEVVFQQARDLSTAFSTGLEMGVF
ncbi:Flavodoxin [Zhongshania aliphaticivorans]|uniref:Flavodoxin n=1 Tax=Zhongshania aliphaticivorans TaxID=1470434 RepID=A0A5S9ND27_9GAMM|nr:flavodoxin [Zhongshania aliphaticivorans]CAA0087838.1 Flavodoxin [Zhongshania aliphaticivorans]CAA0115530.1 Flavodoxin [Zhongshania aliphaticivorans]CAA0120251.1 Flavodoxin [Zhongshania aliphaticivorans]